MEAIGCIIYNILEKQREGDKVKKLKKVWSIAIMIIVLFSVIGCGGLQVIPQAPTTMPTADVPLPLKVGIVIEEQKLTGGFSDFGPSFSDMLKNSNTFKEVYYPVIYNIESIEGSVTSFL